MSIWREYREIQDARRKEASRRMHEYDTIIFYPALKELRKRCAEEGHAWEFTNLGPLGDPWFSCCKCGAAECRREES